MLGYQRGAELGADERTRTSTGLPPLRPERSASTNSATSAGSVDWREPTGWGIIANEGQPAQALMA